MQALTKHKLNTYTWGFWTFVMVWLLMRTIIGTLSFYTIGLRMAVDPPTAVSVNFVLSFGLFICVLLLWLAVKFANIFLEHLQTWSLWNSK